MLQVITILASLVAVTLCLVAYRKWLLQRVARLSLELTQLEQEMDMAERETISRRDLQLKLNSAVSSFNYTDLTAKKGEELFKQKCDIPVPALPAPYEQGKVVMERLGGVLQILNKHSIEIAGVEQVLLNVLKVPNSEVFSQLTFSYFTGLLPPNLQEPAAGVLQQIAQGHLDNIASLGSVASAVVNNVIHLYETNPFEFLNLAESLTPGQNIWTHLLDGPHLEAYSSALTSLSDHIVNNHDAALNATDHLQHAQHLQHAGVGVDHLGNFSGFDAHFPFITAAISVSREIALLKESKTNVGTSLKNASLDVFGTGTGGAVGGTIGTFLIPIPILGTLIGSVAGGMFGRFLSNKVKEKPFKEAKELLEVAVSTLEKEETIAAHQAVRNVHAATTEMKWHFINQIESMPKLDEWERQQLIADAEDLHLRAFTYLQQARLIINTVDKYAGEKWYRGMLLLLAPNLARLTIQLVLVEGKVRKAESMLPTRTLIQSKPVDALERLAYLSVPLTMYNERIEQATKNALQTTNKYRKLMMAWSYR